jgi:hypothetical protein
MLKYSLVLVSILTSSDTVESEGRQMKQCWLNKVHKKSEKIPYSLKPSQYQRDLRHRKITSFQKMFNYSIVNIVGSCWFFFQSSLRYIIFAPSRRNRPFVTVGLVGLYRSAKKTDRKCRGRICTSRVRCGSDCSASACCTAGPCSNFGSAPLEKALYRADAMRITRVVLYE